jgi:hypothetical protein
MRAHLVYMLAVLALVVFSPKLTRGRGSQPKPKPEFHTSDRCLACHNGLTTPSGEDVSIGLDWRASSMANSSRDPYWQASIRRESIDHAESKTDVEDECSVCHMPVTHYQAKVANQKGKVFAYLPFPGKEDDAVAAEDGITCSVCHQISKEKLGTHQSFNGGFVIERSSERADRPEYGPFDISAGNQRIMDSSTGGFRPTQAKHIQDSALCGTCHQLYTTARGPGGKEIGSLPEQMPYLEWLHSDYPGRSSCQMCHMPEVSGQAPISAVLGVQRTGLHQHVFVGGNFVIQGMLNRYRNDLDVAALPQELSSAVAGTLAFLQSSSARISIGNVRASAGKLQAEVFVQNLTGHKLPTAYPSRRAWIHFLVRDHAGHTVFESGALNPDGSIQGNDNDADKERFEPHYREITSGEQVEIFEPILKDSEGKVTTGLLAALGYLKDNRLLPTGFDKKTAEPDIAVAGDALDDPDFVAGGALVRYSVPIGAAEGSLHVEAELWYQPIGFRWAHNLEPYDLPDIRRFVNYYESMSANTATVLARAEAEH